MFAGSLAKKLKNTEFDENWWLSKILSQMSQNLLYPTSVANMEERTWTNGYCEICP